MAMARNIPVKKKTHHRFPVVWVLVIAIILSAVGIFLLFKNIKFFF